MITHPDYRLPRGHGIRSHADYVPPRSQNRVILPIKPESGTSVIERTDVKPRLKPPSKYIVVLMNDDYTSMDFVNFVLVTIFNRTADEVAAITKEIHEKGKGIATKEPTTFEIAETKVYETMNAARKNEFPLLAIMEKAP